MLLLFLLGHCQNLHSVQLEKRTCTLWKTMELKELAKPTLPSSYEKIYRPRPRGRRTCRISSIRKWDQFRLHLYRTTWQLNSRIGFTLITHNSKLMNVPDCLLSRKLRIIHWHF